jgi:hypothetical protein
MAKSQLAPDADRTVHAVSAPTIAEALEELDRLENDAMMQGAFCSLLWEDTVRVCE